ncbi:MAG: hypothetical protein QXF76_02780 [Candidatus Anstonellales archaeon]
MIFIDTSSNPIKLIFTNNVNHDTSLPYTIIFQGLADNSEIILDNQINLSASPFRFLEFDINPSVFNSINTSQQLRIILYDSNYNIIADELGVFKPTYTPKSFLNSNETRKFFD